MPPGSNAFMPPNRISVPCAPPPEIWLTRGSPIRKRCAGCSAMNRASQGHLPLRLRVLQIEPVARAVRAKPLRGDDFIAFNQQLTHLTKAGLPVEHGLRLIAQDMRSGRLAETVRQVAQELERGTPLGEAFEK